MKAIAVIPARLASTRLSRKMLREVAGVPLVGRVYQAVRSSPLLSDVIIATDSTEILEVCRQNGWNARMTSSAHRSGTERVHEVSNSVSAEVYVNVQGDEPLIRAEHIATLLRLMEDPAVQVGTLKTPAASRGHRKPRRGESCHGCRRTCVVFFARDHSLRSRPRTAPLFQAPRTVRLP